MQTTQQAIFLARFISPMYPEDNTIYDAYDTEEDAEARCDSECAASNSAHPNNPDYYFNQRNKYSVEQINLHSRVTE